MTVRKTRLIVVVVVLLGIIGTAGTLFVLRARKGEQTKGMLANVRRLIREEKYDDARAEAEKLMILQPNKAEVRLVRGLALLGNQDPTRIAVTDRQSLDAMANLIKATKLDNNLLEAHEILVRFFVGTGDVREAERHAREVIRAKSDHIDAHYAVAAVATLKKNEREATQEIGWLLKKESPIRPRTMWLAVQIADALRAEDPFREQVIRLLDDVANRKGLAQDVQDRLALVEISAWRSLRNADPVSVQAGLQEAIVGLNAILTDGTWSDKTPRLMYGAIDRLVPAIERQSEQLKPIFAQAKPQLAQLQHAVFQQAISHRVVDPQIYLEYANRLRRDGQTDKACEVIEAGLAIGRDMGDEIRRMFSVCDLWLAEHYIAVKQAEKAQPHIDIIIQDERLKPFGQLMQGLKAVQANDWETASKYLAPCVQKLPDNGLANVLYGLTQLRRNYLTEARQHLQKGIQLGADDPRYRAWLAVALADAGYPEKALEVASRVRADGATNSLTNVLQAQVHLRSGNFAAAEKALQDASVNADDKAKLRIQLMQLELAIARKDEKNVTGLLTQLKQAESTAAQAAALEYRWLVAQDQPEQARAALTAARKKYPQNMGLIELEVVATLEAGNKDQAIKMLQDEVAAKPTEPRLALLLSDCYDSAKQTDKSIETLQLACKRMPDESNLSLRLAEKLLAAKKFEEAGRTLADLKANPLANQGTVDALLAHAAALKGDNAKAEELIEVAYKKDPDNPIVKKLYAQVLARRQDFAKARDIFQSSMNSAGRSADTLGMLAETMIRLGETDGVLKLLDRADKTGQSGQVIDSLRERVLRLLARSEKWPELKIEMKRLLESNPSEANCAFGVSLYRYMNEYDLAEQLLNASLKQYPKSLLLLEHKVAIMLERKQYAEVDSLTTELIKEFPQEATFHVLAIYSQLERNQLEKADQYAERAWKMAPGNPALLALRVQTLLRLNQPQDALSFAKQATAKYTELPNPNYVVARVYEALGSRDKAIAMLSTATSESPKDIMIAHHYLRMRIAEGQLVDLKTTLDRMLEQNGDHPLLLGVLIEYHCLKNEMPAAEAVLKKLLTTNATLSVKAYSEAVVAVSKKDFPTAEKKLVIALGDPRGHLPSQFLLARVYSAQNRYEQALDVMNQIIRQQPNSPIAHSMKVEYLYRLNRKSEAEKICRDYLVQFPRTRSFQIILMQLLAERPEESAKQESVKIADAMIGNTAESPIDFERCSRVLLRSGNIATVMNTLKEFSGAKNKHDLYASAVRALVASNRQNDAVKLLEPLLAEPGTPAVIRFLYAEAIANDMVKGSKESRYQRAGEELRKVLKEEPGNLLAVNNLVWLIGQTQKEPRKALDELYTYLPAARRPSESLPPELLDTIGSLHLALNRTSEAEAFLELAVKLRPTSAAAQFHLGQAYVKANRADRARICFDKVIELDAKGPYAAQLRQQGMLAP